MIDDLPLPPEWLAAAHDWAPSVLAALILTTALARLALPVARRVELWAVTTPATWDDGPARSLVSALEWLVAATSAVLAWLPRLTMGPAPASPRSAPRPPAPPPPGTGAALLLLALALSPLLHGCGGGVPRAYRVGVDGYAEGVALMDEAVERRIHAEAPEARAIVRGEVASRQILGVTPEETASLALERYDEIMSPLRVASEAARYAAAGALALERALDAWDAQATRQPFLVRAACAVAAIMALADAVLAAGIELPARATSVVETMSTWSSESCPEGGAW